MIGFNKISRGRQVLEKDKAPDDRLSRRFFSEEKYHYSQNLEIEDELRYFKKEIELKFRKSKMNQNYQFLRIADRKSSNENMNEKDCQIKSQALQGRQSSNADQINPNQDNSENNEFRIFNTID